MPNTTVSDRDLTKQLTRRELMALEHLRLERGWTYDEFAAEITRVAGIRLPSATLVRLLTTDAPHRGRRRSTIYPIRKFLAAQATKKPAREARAS